MKRIGLFSVTAFYIVIPVLLILCAVSLYLYNNFFQVSKVHRNVKIKLEATEEITDLLPQKRVNLEEIRLQKKGHIYSVYALLLLYLIIYIYLTFICRNPTTKPKIRLIPFLNYRKAFELFPFKIKRLSTAREIFMNILLTIPLGLFFPILFYWKKHPHILTLFVAFAISLLTETFQYLTHLGVCEVDDLFSNMIGCLLGVLIVTFGTKFIHHCQKFVCSLR